MLTEQEIAFMNGEPLVGNSISERPYLDGEHYELGSGKPAFDWLPPIGEASPLTWWNQARTAVKNLNDVFDDEIALKWAMLCALAEAPAVMSIIWQIRWQQLVTIGERLQMLDSSTTSYLPQEEDEDELQIVPDTEE